MMGGFHLAGPMFHRSLRHCSAAVSALLCCLASASSAAAEKRGITEKDLFDFIWIGDVQVSPDGARVAFVRVTANEKKEGYDTAIWAVPTDGSEQPRQ